MRPLSPRNFFLERKTPMSVHKRTVTEKRRAANRAAATQSTGPRTEQGKQRSVFNSFKHGLYASQDAVIQQAFIRSGLDPVQYSQLHQAAALSLRPQDAVQALLVEDLVRLYCLKNLYLRSSAEWQARQAETFRFQCDQRWVGVWRNEVIDDRQVDLQGWMWVADCWEKFRALYDLLNDLDDLARNAQWDKPKEPHPEAEFKSQLTEEEALKAPTGTDGQLVEMLLGEIYGGRFTWWGKRIRRLFAECAEDRASAEDPRVVQLRKLIRDERKSIKDVHRSYEQGRDRHIEQPDSADHPDLRACGEQWWTMVNREAAFDRQIASKLQLLMKLQSAASEREVDEDEVPDATETSPSENDAGSPGEPAAPPESFTEDKAAAAPPDDSKEPAPVPEAQPPVSPGPAGNADAENTETNPKSTITASESADPSQPDEPESHARDPQTPPSEPSVEPVGGMR
jgi:hypothetical protein